MAGAVHQAEQRAPQRVTGVSLVSIGALLVSIGALLVSINPQLWWAVLVGTFLAVALWYRSKKLLKVALLSVALVCSHLFVCVSFEGH